MNQRRPAQSPAQSVDALAVLPAPEPRAPARVKRLFVASLVLAGVAWLGTLATAVVSSETNAIVASWVAMWPSAFGIAGLLALSNKTTPARAIGVAAAVGTGGCVLFAMFYAVVWPAL